MSDAPYTPEEIKAIEDIKRKAATTLRERRKFFGVPEVEFVPADGDVILFRLPHVERKTETGIVLADFELNNLKNMNESQLDQMVSHQIVVNNGLVLSAGPSADDWLLSQGIFYGDIVKFGRFAGQEQRGDMYTLSNSVDQSTMKDILDVNFRDIRGSFDLYSRLYVDPVIEKRMVVDPAGNWMHVYKPIVRS
jgi:co-chaperonin GroES (HSP10)